MDTIKSSAKDSHGVYMYDLIWNARKNNQTLSWVLVLFITIFQLILASLVAGGIGYFLASIEDSLQYKSNMLFAVELVFFTSVVFSPVLVAFFEKESAFRNTSQFISVAGGMSRIMKNSTSSFARIFAKFWLCVSGVLAVYSAFSIWIFYQDKLEKLSPSELDVLGNALSHSGVFWEQSRYIFDNLFERESISSKDPLEARQISISFGMACKWMLSSPYLVKEEKKNLQENIRDIMEHYPDLPEEVTVRFNEVFSSPVRRVK